MFRPLDQASRGDILIEWLWPWMLVLAPLPWLVRRFAPPASSQAPALRAPFFEEWQQLSEGQSGRRSRTALLPLAGLWLLWLLLLVAAASFSTVRRLWVSVKATPGRDSARRRNHFSICPNSVRSVRRKRRRAGVL